MTWTYYFSRKLEPRTAHDFHILNVYADPEFQNAVKELLPDRDEILVQIEKSKSVNYKEKLFNELVKTMSKIPKAKIKSIADYYAVAVNDITLYMNGQNAILNFVQVQKPSYLIAVNDEGRVNVQFNDDITKDDFDLIWKTVIKLKKNKYGNSSQPKPFLNHHLIYAVFKARNTKPKPTFLEVWWLYNEDKLKGYTQEIGLKRKQFSNYKSLQTYYNKYKPKVTPSKRAK